MTDKYGRAIRCNAADSDPLRGLGATGGDTGPPKMVGAEGYRLETGTGEERKRGDGGNDNRHGRGGDNGAGSGGNIGFRHGIGGGEGGGGVTGSQWLQWGGVERGGDRIKTNQTPDDQRYTGLSPNVANLRLKIGPESRGSLSRCSGMELHHPIMSKLWNLGGQTKRKKERLFYENF